MSTELLEILEHLPDEELLARVRDCVGREVSATARLAAHLAVLDARRLYLAEGHPSLYAYCLHILHLSEHATYGRIAAARCARRFPVVLDYLADGRLNLTAVVLLAPHLNATNHRDLMEAARHRTRREVEEVLAQWRPAAPVDDSMRRLPERRAVLEQPLGPAPPASERPTWAGSASAPGQGVFPIESPEATAAGVAAGGDSAASDPERTDPSTTDERHAAAPPPEDRSAAGPAAGFGAPPTTGAALPGRYRIQFMTDADTYRKLLQVRELMRHQVPTGDLGVIFDRALSLLHDDLARRKFGMLKSRGAGAAGGPGRPARVSAARDPGAADANSGPKRHIPAEVRRGVWRRDGGRCAFLSASGQRCPERGWLEFHHLHPFARGGASTVDNLQLRCRAHNIHASEADFRPYDPSG